MSDDLLDELFDLLPEEPVTKNAKSAHANLPKKKKTGPSRRDIKLAKKATNTPAVEEYEGPSEVQIKEQTTLAAICKEKNMVVVDIAPDGHCLYSAIADQLNYTRIAPGIQYRELRQQCALFMKQHSDDFAPFLEIDDGDSFEAYCDRIENTGEWGGHPEILALSRVHNVTVNVVQQGPPPILTLGEGKSDIWLIYHLTSFGLGEHYNSLHAAPEIQ